ncbi:lytic transglycosylase domain-containing protein [Anaerovibrio sp.]|uniref:lytic transglycosylase domain-containing protein n=1 Tax=Anaerovibrio sp. TaxID=1872532 RepID=UPI003F179EB1
MNGLQKIKQSIYETVSAIIFWTVLILSVAFGIAMQDAEAAAIPEVIAGDVGCYNSNSTQTYWITDAICYASSLYQVDPLLVTAVMETESHFSFNTFYVPSSAGAIGLMQLMPGTASAVGVDPYDPLGNIVGGTAYLRNMLDNFAGYGEYAVTNAVAAYNAGPAAVTTYGGCPPYNETQNYVIRVSDAYNRLLTAYYSQ